jgi:hypothetical protein
MATLQNGEEDSSESFEDSEKPSEDNKDGESSSDSETDESRNDRDDSIDDSEEKSEQPDAGAVNDSLEVEDDSEDLPLAPPQLEDCNPQMILHESFFYRVEDTKDPHEGLSISRDSRLFMLLEDHKKKIEDITRYFKSDSVLPSYEQLFTVLKFTIDNKSEQSCDPVLNRFSQQHFISQKGSSFTDAQQQAAMASLQELKIDHSLTQKIKKYLQNCDDVSRNAAFGSIIPRVTTGVAMQLAIRAVYGQYPLSEDQQRHVTAKEMETAFLTYYTLHCLAYSKDRAAALVDLYQQFVHDDLMDKAGLGQQFANFKGFAVSIDAGHKLKRGALGIIL